MVAGDDQVQMFSTSFLTENCLSLQFLKGLKTFYMLQHFFVPYWTTEKQAVGTMYELEETMCVMDLSHVAKMYHLIQAHG